ncbi:MAG TPA: AAA family ATPase, partial [Thermoplasmatales archaeon]|nr:AAA family ATPase [Thermoplasmatales archaeon]
MKLKRRRYNNFSIERKIKENIFTPPRIKSVIVKDAGKLELSYVPDKILCRDEEIKKLQVFLKSGRVLISGGVGTGKTLLARYVGGDAYINCYMNKTEHRVVEEMLRQLKPPFNPAGLPTQKLWNEIEEGKTVIIDEIDGMNADELRHFAYSLSRQYELGKRINYIAITRNHFILEQIINDDAIWSTFADRAIVELKPYTFEEIKEILEYRARESIYPGAYDDEILSLIADIALHSPGHMRTAIDLLRNAALLAEGDGRKAITPDDVREVNREEWISDVESMDKDMLLVMLAVATVCRNKAYAEMEEIKEMLKIKEEEYGMKIGERKMEEILQILTQQDFIYRGERGYTILNYP